MNGKGEEGARGLVVGKESDHWKHSQKSLRSAVGSWNHQKKSLTFLWRLKFFSEEKLERYKRNKG